jgi:WD40 repeat protein
MIRPDLFLSYHVADRESVLAVRDHLRARGITTFLDRDNLPPGWPWPQALEEALRSARAVAVFLGPGGLGPWQKREVAFALDRQGQEEKAGTAFPVVPVLLPNADLTPGFLFLNTLLDLRQDVHDASVLDRLVEAVRGAQLPPADDAGIPLCPYRGLRAFREEDAGLFFGREAFQSRLLHAVLTGRVAAVVGPSGSGKSSAVYAGLTPLLRRQRPPAPIWDLVSFTPGNRPFHRLGASLIPFLEQDKSEVDRLEQAQKLGDGLASGVLSLEGVVEDVLSKSHGTSRLLIVIDQFEELFTPANAGSRTRLVGMLLNALESSPLTLLFTLRGDFYGDAIGLSRELSDSLEKGIVNLVPMTRQELEASTVKPAQRVGLSFEPGLVNRILDDVGEAPGRLPLLEFALTELWTKRKGRLMTHAAYDEFGGVAKAITRRADTEFARLTADQQTTARKVFTRLVQVAGPEEDGKNTLQRVKLIDINPAARPVLTTFADARLLVTARDEAGEEIVEIAHVALIEEWTLLRSWLRDDRRFLEWRQRLQERVADWERGKRDEGGLLHGALIAEAERWLAERPGDLRQRDSAYIEASRLNKARQDQEWKALYDESERQRRLALSRRLAAEALNYAISRPDLELLLSLEACRSGDTFEARSSLLKGLRVDSHLSAFLMGHKDDAWGVAFSPDGRFLVSGSGDGVIRWDLASRQQVERTLTGHAETRPISPYLDENTLPETRFAGDVWCLAVSPVGKLLATGGRNDTVILWDLEAGQPLGEPLTEHQQQVVGLGGITGVTFSPDGAVLAARSGTSSIILWNVATRKPLGAPLFTEPGDPATVPVRGGLLFSPDGKLLASCGDGVIRLWDVAKLTPLGKPLRPHGRVLSMAFSPDSRMLVSGGDLELQFWNLKTRKPDGNAIRGFHGGSCPAVAFSSDGKIFASANADSTIILWDLATRTPSTRFSGHPKPASSLAFSKDGSTLASAGADEKVILWQVAAGPGLGRLLHGGEERSVKSLAFSRDGTLLASCSEDSTSITLWDVRARRQMGVSLTDPGPVLDVAFSPDGTWLASGNEGPDIVLREAKGGRIAGRLTGHQGALRTLAFSSDGRFLATPCYDSVVVWDLGILQNSGTGPPGTSLPNHEAQTHLGGDGWAVTHVAFSPAAKVVAATSYKGTITLFDLATGQPVTDPLAGHRPRAVSSAFSPDGSLLVSVGKDGGVVSWDLEARPPEGTPLDWHPQNASCCAFNRDGKLLATGTRDGEVVLWDVDSRRPLGALHGHRDRTSCVVFSPDGTLLASGSQDGAIVLWDVDVESWQRRACAIANRNLTLREWRQFMGDETYRKTCPNLPGPE